MKRWRKIIKYLMLSCLVLAVFVIFALYYFWHENIIIPNNVIGCGRKLLNKFTEYDFTVSNLSIIPYKYTISADSFNLGIIASGSEDVNRPIHHPFMKIGSFTAVIASDSALLDLFNTKVAVEHVKISNLFFDITAPLPKSDSSKVSLPWIPVRAADLKGLFFASPFGNFDLNDFICKFSRTKEKSHFDFSCLNGPFGSSGTISADILMNSGMSLIKCDLKQKADKLLPYINTFLKSFGIKFKDFNSSVDLSYYGNIIDRINNPKEKLNKLITEELYGSIDVNDCELIYGPINVSCRLHADRKADSIWNYSLIGSLLDGKFTAKGNWLGETSEKADYSLELCAEDIKPTKKLLNDLKIMTHDEIPFINFGSICFSGNFNGTLDTIYGKGVLSAPGWTVCDSPIQTFETEWLLNEDLILSSDHRFKSNFCNISASSTLSLYGPKQNDLSFNGQFGPVDLNFIGKILDQNINGQAGGNFKGSCNLMNLKEIVYEASISTDDGCNFFGITPKKVSGLLKGKGSEFYLLDPEFEFSNKGKASVKGRLSLHDCDGKVQVSNLAFNKLGIKEDIATGTVDLKADLSGELFKPVLKGHAYGQGIKLMGLEINKLNADIAVKDDQLVMHPMYIKFNDHSSVDGFTTISLLTGLPEAVSLSIQNLYLPSFKSFIPAVYAGDSLDGLISGSVNYNKDKNKKTEHINFLVDGRDINIANQPIDSIYSQGNADISFDKSGLKQVSGQLEGLFIRAFGGTFNLYGQIINTDRFSGYAEGKNLKYKNMLLLQKFLPGFSGLLDFEGNVDFKGLKKSGYFTVSSSNMRVGEKELGNFGGNIKVNDEKLIIDNGDFDKLKIKLSGEIDWAGKRPYKANIDMNNVDFSFFPRSHKILAIDEGGLLVDGKCIISGNLNDLVPDFGKIQINKLTLCSNGENMETAKPIDITWQNGGFEVRSFELKYLDGIIGGEGIYRPNESTAFMFAGRNFSVDALSQLCGAPKGSLDGNLSFDANLFGTEKNPTLKAKGEINNLKSCGKILPGVNADLSADLSNIKINDISLHLPNSVCSLKGIAELKEDFKLGKYDFSLHLPNAPLTDLTCYVPDVIKSASGTLDLNLYMKSGSSGLGLSGGLNISADHIAAIQLKKPITDIDIDLNIENDVINFNKMQMSLGKGTMNSGGYLSLSPSNFGALDINSKGDKLEIGFNPLDLTNVDYKMTLKGDIFNPDFKAFVLLPKSKFNLDAAIMMMDSESSSSNIPLESAKYDIHVTIPNNFRVKSAFMNSELAGDFGITGDLENFKLDGAIRCLNGKLFFKQRQFKISEGEIKFGGIDNSFDPYINIKSEGQVQSTKIFLTLNGFLSDFKPSVYSTPPMSEGDIIAMLTLGRDLSSALEGDTKELFEDEILEGLKNSYLSSLVGNTLSEALNLDEVYLTSVFDKSTGKTQSYIRVGKGLTDKLFIAYEGNMDENEEGTYMVEYKLPRNFLLNLEFEQPERNQSIGLKYDWKF